MADFSIPFARDAELRYPSQLESEQGFPCGPADRRLFNGLQHRVEAEIGNVISFAGITPTDERHTLLREAIEALISAATGGGETSQFVLVSQARARLLFFPEVLNVDGRIVVTSPADGTIRIPGGVDILHRGIFPVTTVQFDMVTDPSKTYHVRWNPTDGFVLKDVASPAYNPSTLAEGNFTFDSTYDDMLVARVITNSSNVATITNLSNKHKLNVSQILQGTNGQNVGTHGAKFDFTLTLNWARSPTLKALDFVHKFSNGAPQDDDFSFRPLGASVDDMQTLPPLFDLTRYRLSQTAMHDFATTLYMNFNASA